MNIEKRYYKKEWEKLQKRKQRQLQMNANSAPCDQPTTLQSNLGVQKKLLLVVVLLWETMDWHS